MKSNLKLTILVIAAGLLWAGVANAAFSSPFLPPAGFTVVGFIQEATLDGTVAGHAAAPLVNTNPGAGGTITVNGIKILVPNNSVIQMPAAAFTWAEMFNPAVSHSVNYIPARPNHRAFQTGLALADNPLSGTRAGVAGAVGPFPSFEVTVQGNIVFDPAGAQKYIAALIVPVSQQSLNSGAGIVNYIDFPVGRFRVGGIMNDPLSGTLCEINDPITATPPSGPFSPQTGDGDGRFGKQHSPDPRFTADTTNPTITTSTGYPAGLPRVAPSAIPVPAGEVGDTTRPYTQRPRNDGVFVTGDPFLPPNFPLKTFTMPDVNHVVAGSPDPRKQVPIMVGDWVTYSGTLFKINPLGPNTAANTFVSVHTLEVDLGVYTAPNTTPVYVKCDVALIGTDGGPAPPAPAPNGNPADLPILIGSTVALPFSGSPLPGEFSRRARFEGFCTDVNGVDPILKGFGNAFVTTYAVDDVTQALIQVPDEDGGGKGRGNPASVEIVPAGRYRFQGSKLNLGPPVAAIPLTREYRVVHSNGVFPTPVCNGLTAGQFQLPNFAFITPERTTLGSPQYPGNFFDLPFLSNLDPFPGTAGPNPGPPSNQPPLNP